MSCELVMLLQFCEPTRLQNAKKVTGNLWKDNDKFLRRLESILGPDYKFKRQW